MTGVRVVVGMYVPQDGAERVARRRQRQAGRPIKPRHILGCSTEEAVARAYTADRSHPSSTGPHNQPIAPPNCYDGDLWRDALRDLELYDRHPTEAEMAAYEA
jgi:hypothetical protein